MIATNDSSVVAISVSNGGSRVNRPAVCAMLPRRLEQRAGPAEHPERHEDADRQKGEQLDDRFGRDRQHQAVLMLGGVDMAGAEQHREGRHRQRHEQRDVAEQRPR